MIKKLNDRGFAISGILYSLLILVVILMFLTLAILANRYMTLSKVKKEAEEEIAARSYYYGDLVIVTGISKDPNFVSCGQERSVARFTRRTINVNIKLPELNCMIKYDFSVENIGPFNMQLIAIIEDVYTNNNIIYEMAGLKIGDIILPGETLNPSIIFRYWTGLSTVPTNKDLKSTIRFVWRRTWAVPKCTDYYANTLRCRVLAKYGYEDIIEAKPLPDFNKRATGNDGMYAMRDESGMSYFFRGNVTDNNVIFAEHQWKIVRINGDGSVRLIYNGVCPDNSCTINSGGAATDIGTTPFNSASPSSNAHVGYMFGTPFSNTYEAEHESRNNSTIKTKVDNWYRDNIANQGTVVTSKIVDSPFCGDRSIDYVGSWNGNLLIADGYGTMLGFYGANMRMFSEIVGTAVPNFSCTFTNDSYTVEDIRGNGALIYPVGLITTDEVYAAGAIWGNITGSDNPNTSFYLHTGRDYWTMTPSAFYHTPEGNPPPIAYVWQVLGNGSTDGRPISRDWAVRPVINVDYRALASATGIGTASNPYVIEGMLGG